MTVSDISSVDTLSRPESIRQKSSLALLAAAYPSPLSFEERLSGLDRASVASSAPANPQGNIEIATLGLPKSDSAPPPPVARQVASIPVPTPPRRPAEARPPQSKSFASEDLVRRAKATVLASTGSTTPGIFDKLFGKSESKPEPRGPQLAYASADAGVTSDGRDIEESPSPRSDRMTAVYDISAHTVYMPDGSKLEAHSGLGGMLDDPRHVRERMRGATPPHIYDLAMRESLFHGVAAIRLKPVGGEEAIFGRSGLLAHTYMLGPKGDSNGCVSFKDYNAFLQAYKEQRVKRLVVVAHLD